MDIRKPIFKYLLIAALFLWSVWVFFPGSYSVDSLAIFDQAAKHYTTDWYAPIMASLWGFLYAATGLYYAMFLLQLLFYWLFIALLLVHINNSLRIFYIGLFVAIILLFIPQYVMKDSHHAIAWGLAMLLFLIAYAGKRYRKWLAFLALLLLAYGLFARINMIAALLPLCFVFIETFYQSARGLFFKVLASLSLCALMFGANQLLNYKVLKAEKTYPQYKLRLLDITGITLATGHNYLPPCITSYKDYSYDTIRRLYSPASFDEIYWPPNFRPVVPMPDSALNDCVKTAWQNALSAHPFVYLRNRADGFLYYLRIKKRFKDDDYWNVAIWIDPSNPFKASRKANIFIGLLNSVYAPLSHTFIYSPWFWLLINTVFFVLYIRRYRRHISRVDLMFLAMLQLSGILAILSQFPIYQHDRDFRYCYWNVFVFFIGCVYAAGQKAARSLAHFAD